LQLGFGHKLRMIFTILSLPPDLPARTNIAISRFDVNKQTTHRHVAHEKLKQPNDCNGPHNILTNGTYTPSSNLVRNYTHII